MSRLKLRQLQALTWELCQPHRKLFWWIAAALLASLALNMADGAAFDASEEAESLPDVLQEMLFLLATFLAFHIFSLTELDSRKARQGFPRRLFVLPVSSLTLVAVPVMLGFVAVETIFTIGYVTGIAMDMVDAPVWGGLKLGAFMLTCQLILWSCAGLGSLRLVFIGISSFFFIVLGKNPVSTALLFGWTLIAFLWSWATISRQRSGGGKRQRRMADIAASMIDALPRRKCGFASPQSALFWYEWRQAGFILPLAVSMLLLIVIAPLSLLTADSARSTPILLGGLLLTPLIMACAAGKALSKADLWSADMGVPAFLAVKPVSAETIVLVKIRVAVLSMLITWGLLISFAFVWLQFWANLELLHAYGNFIWATQGHSLPAHYATAALTVIACMLLTWRLLVVGLWIGLSRHRACFTWASMLLVLAVMLGPALYYEVFDWVSADYERLGIVVWLGAALVIAKFWLAAWSWRAMTAKHTLHYFGIWLAGTGCMLALALLLDDSIRSLASADSSRVQTLLIFAALLIMPLAQLALAPVTLADNRHR